MRRQPLLEALVHPFGASRHLPSRQWRCKLGPVNPTTNSVGGKRVLLPISFRCESVPAAHAGTAPALSLRGLEPTRSSATIIPASLPNGSIASSEGRQMGLRRLETIRRGVHA